MFIHQIRHRDELEPRDILNSKVIEEPNRTNDNPYEQTKGPLEENVSQLVGASPAPPILIEEVVLDQPEPNPHHSFNQNPEKKNTWEIRIQMGKLGYRLLVIEALDGARVGADDGELGGVVGGAAAEVDGVVLQQGLR